MAQIQRQATAVLSVSLPKELKKQVVSYAKKNDITVSQYIKQKLEDDFFMEEWDEVTKGFQKAFKQLGLKTDEDVEKYFG